MPYHSHLDNTCGLESEEIQRSNFDDDLRFDMTSLPLWDLARKYPELEFAHTKDKDFAKTGDYIENLRGKQWVVGWWRRAS